MERGQGRRRVNKQTHLPVVLAGKLPSKSPTYARITEIVDDRTEDVAIVRCGGRHVHSALVLRVYCIRLIQSAKIGID